jgi:hypothetical protein
MWILAKLRDLDQRRAVTELQTLFRAAVTALLPR